MFRISDKHLIRKWFKAGALAVAGLLVTPAVWAAGPPAPSSMSDPLVISLVVLMLLLLLVIALLANVLLGTAQFQQENERKSGASKLAMIAGLLLVSSSTMAQTAAPAAEAATTYGGLSATTFFLIVGVITVEIVVILFMLLQLKAMLAKEKQRKVEEAAAAGLAPAKPGLSWWDRFNSFKPVEEEADLDLGHDYDGIRELNNRLPPWWLYGFYITIVAAGIYLYRFHVAHSAPLSAQELANDMKAAELRQAEYLKTAANLVDENSVKLSTAAADLADGKSIFVTNCKPCHGEDGSGMIGPNSPGAGPNLTDDYWIHGGSINEVFKSIKYGWQEKGMRSWKDDFTASQISHLASFVKSLKGTRPVEKGGKAPQGELYNEAAAGAAKPDSTSAAKGVDTAAKK